MQNSLFIAKNHKLKVNLIIRKNKLQKNWQDLVADVGDEKKIIAVSKNYPLSDLLILHQLGVRKFGENKVQELSEKAAHWPAELPVQFHFIGHLQKNKVKALLKIPNLVAIHSVDSVKLLQTIVELEKNFLGEKLDLFLQVNTSKEEEKGGFLDLNELQSAIEFLSTCDLKKIKLAGLMTMATYRTEDNMAEAKRCFSQLADYRHRLDSKLLLSMGMSADYKLALELGSDLIRVGSTIFSDN